MQLSFSPTTGVSRTPGMSGLGLDVTSNTIASEAMSGAAMTGTILTGLAHMGMISAAFGPAAPIAAIVVGLAAIGIGIANLFKGCGQTCVRATEIANQLQTYWQNNLDTYMNATVHYKSLQLAALNNFDVGWTAMYKGCSDPSLGAAGQRCISERQRGGASVWCCNSPTAVHVGNGMCTGCDAFHDFRDPIANDPNVVPDPQEASAISSSLGINTGGHFPIPLLLGAGLILFAMVSDN